jgi:hypothetical protein
VDVVSEWGWRHALGSIISTAMKSAITTDVVAMTGSSATIHPATPVPARAIRPSSCRRTPPLPREMESRKTAHVPTAWVRSGRRLQRAPSARCDSKAITSMTLQISQEPRCGTVHRRQVSRR